MSLYTAFLGQFPPTSPPRRVRSMPSQPRVTMLRVQRKRRPNDWEKKNSELTGRFLPLDPRDEKVLDALEEGARPPELVKFGPEGPPSLAYGSSGAAHVKQWSKRSQAAQKRWADASYRARMLKMRAEKKLLNEKKNGVSPKRVPPKHKVEIGPMDSVTMCNDDKARAINQYTRSNKVRSEKLSSFHRNRKVWMERRLGEGEGNLSDEEYVAKKKEIQEKRRNIALKRAQRKREKEKQADKPQEDLVNGKGE